MQQQITSAFGHRRRPAIVTNIEVCSSLRDDARHFEGMDWSQVTADDWKRYGDAFFGLSPEAFAYFLPSVLALSFDESNLPLVVADALITSLDTSGDPELWDDWFSERFRQLTSPELKVLQDWSTLYLAGREKGEGSEFVRVRETLAMLQLVLEC